MAIVNSQLLLRARRFADDLVAPYYTDDATMYTYLSEAEREIASVGRMLRTELTFNIEAATQYVDYSAVAEVIELRAAEIVDDADNHWQLRLQGVMDFLPDNNRYDYGISPMVPKTGRPSALIFGRISDNFELAPIPEKAYTLNVQVITYPDVAIEYGSDYPSIPDRYHHLIPIGAAMRAVETYPTDNNSSAELAGLTQQWNRALERTRKETSIIARDGGNVKFMNDLWWGSY